MPTLTIRDPLLASFAPRLAALEPRTRAAVAGVPDEKLHATPPGGGWSMAQAFEHLCIANTSYVVPITRSIATARTRKGPPRTHRPTLFGGLLAGALAESNVKKLRAPKIFVPLEPRANVVEEFLSSLRWLDQRVQEADGLDLRVMMSSPVASFLRLNLGEALVIEVIHAERHLGQVERTRQAVGA